MDTLTIVEGAAIIWALGLIYVVLAIVRERRPKVEPEQSNTPTLKGGPMSYLCHACFFARQGACTHPDGADLRVAVGGSYCANWYSTLVDAVVFLRIVQEVRP